MRHRFGFRGMNWLAALGLLVLFLSNTSAQSGSLSESIVPRWSAPNGLAAESTAKAVMDDNVPQIVAHLLISADGSETPRVGVLFDLAPGWHLYWRNPGDTGIAPELGLKAEQLTFGEIDWPVPSVFEEGDGLFTTYGYEGQVLLSAPFSVLASQTEAAGPVPSKTQIIRAHPRVLICRAECVPASFDLSSSASPDLHPAEQASIDALFANTRAQWPISGDLAPTTHSVLARWSNGNPAVDESSSLTVTFQGCKNTDGPCPLNAPTPGTPAFLPFEDQPFEFDEMQPLPATTPGGDWGAEITATRLEPGGDRLRGLVPFIDEQGLLRHAEIDLAVQPPRSSLASEEGTLAAPSSSPNAESNAAPAMSMTTPGALANTASNSDSAAHPKSSKSPSAARWAQALLLALIGGLILNGMPCVLPVLAIKIVAIADLAEKDPKEVRLQGLAYTAGVLGSMMLLGAAVLALRSAGHSVGWGFQFQEPLFIAGISAVLVTFALNLFGVFEIDFGQGRLASMGQTGSATRRSLFEGLLAVVLATPCTAPFLGTAVGFAFAAPGLGILGIFLAIGLGLALPFLIVSFVPGFARFIPRSGPWMLKLRAGLGFCLLATVVWLLWIVGQSGDINAVVAMLGLLLLLSFMLWTFGLAQPLKSVWYARGSALLIAIITFTGFNLIEFRTNQPSAAALTSVPGEVQWATYSEESVAAALAEGKPAFVVFTADWCITCQVNEKRVIDQPQAHQAFANSNVALFKADWTRRDESIRAKLAEFGRAGVPLYLVYSPAAPHDPQVLSELISHKELQTALTSAAYLGSS